MARINIEECWWSDPRRTRLLLKIGFEADSAAVNMWRTAQEFWSRGKCLIPKEVFDKINHSEALIEAGLADVRERSVYVRGSSEYLTWLEEKREQASAAGKKSAEIRKLRLGTAQPKGGKGHEKSERNPNGIRTEVNGTEPSGSGSGSSSGSKIKKYNNAQPDGFADFWAGYPRKVGKTKAMALFASAIKAGATKEQILKALNRYKEHLQKEGTESRYILHGKTFMGTWRDWLDPQTGQSESFANDKPVYDWAEITGQKLGAV